MLVIKFIETVYRDLFLNFYLIGKILFFPLFLAFCICFIVIATFEIVVIDSIAILIFACSKNVTVRDYFNALGY